MTTPKSGLARERNLSAFKPCANVALWDVDALLGKVFEAKLDGITRVVESVLNRITLRDDARQRRDDRGKPSIGSGFEHDRVTAGWHECIGAPDTRRNPAGLPPARCC